MKQRTVKRKTSDRKERFFIKQEISPRICKDDMKEEQESPPLNV